jgi:hypothetical protein
MKDAKLSKIFSKAMLSHHFGDNLGYIKAHYVLANSEERLKQMKRQAELADSLAEINRVDKEESTKKKSNEVLMLTLAVPAAVKKYREKGYDASKLTKVELASLLIVVYFIDISQNPIEESICRCFE